MYEHGRERERERRERERKRENERERNAESVRERKEESVCVRVCLKSWLCGKECLIKRDPLVLGQVQLRVNWCPCELLDVKHVCECVCVCVR